MIDKNKIREKGDFWKKIAINDLKAIYKILRANHPGCYDNLNPVFLHWLEKGYALSQKKAEITNSYATYIYTLRFYINGFQDNHLALRAEQGIENIKWPGFFVTYQNKRFIVKGTNKNDADFTWLPPKNSELILCNNRKPAYIMKQNIFPYFGIETLEAAWHKWCPYLTLDMGNPWQMNITKCTFKYNQTIKEHNLEWGEIRIREIERQINEEIYTSDSEYSITEFAGNGVWIRIPSFLPALKNEQELNALIDLLTQFRDREIIVFDCRGNSGGNSQWGVNILTGLYGKEFVDYLISYDDKGLKKTFVEWRVSEDNLNYIQKQLVSLEKKFGTDAQIYQIFHQISEGMHESLIKKKELYREMPIIPESDHAFFKKPRNLVKGKVFFLTDCNCASACLSFADLLLEIENVIHVGHPTYADSVYMDSRSIQLPSRLAHLFFPIKVYRNRKRNNNQPYIPRYIWKENIKETKKIQEWIISIAA